MAPAASSHHHSQAHDEVVGPGAYNALEGIDGIHPLAGPPPPPSTAPSQDAAFPDSVHEVEVVRGRDAADDFAGL